MWSAHQKGKTDHLPIMPTLSSQIRVKCVAQACFAELSSLYQYMWQTQHIKVSALSSPSQHFQISYFQLIFFSSCFYCIARIHITQTSLEIQYLDATNATIHAEISSHHHCGCFSHLFAYLKDLQKKKCLIKIRAKNNNNNKELCYNQKRQLIYKLKIT